MRRNYVEPQLRFNGGQLSMSQTGQDGLQPDQAHVVRSLTTALLDGQAQVESPLIALPQAHRRCEPPHIIYG
ncbi:MAG: hypothetical protein HC828_02560 [Blastochloris sp.]|nr:hypothetical protein [Blastochloris sp.]